MQANGRTAARLHPNKGSNEINSGLTNSKSKETTIWRKRAAIKNANCKYTRRLHLIKRFIWTNIIVYTASLSKLIPSGVPGRYADMEKTFDSHRLFDQNADGL